jgi:hypothetical protein
VTYYSRDGKDDLAVGGTRRAMDTGAHGYVHIPGGSPHWPGLIGGSLLTMAAAMASLHLLWSSRPPWRGRVR